MANSDKTESQGSEFERKHWIKLAIDFGPLVAFVGAYILGKVMLSDAAQAIYWATGTLMVATFLSVVASKVFLGRVESMLRFTAGLVGVFGALTLVLHDDQFIKMKPTMLYSIFGVGLLGGLAANRYFLKSAFSNVMNLTDEGWRHLTIRWALFFFGLAGLNEYVWRTYSESAWVTFKFPGAPILTMIFAASQIGLLKRFEKVQD